MNPGPETGDLFGAEVDLSCAGVHMPTPADQKRAAAILASSTPTQAALVSAALRVAAARQVETIDIGSADPPDGCVEITSLVDPRRRYMSQHSGRIYIGRAVFP